MMAIALDDLRRGFANCILCHPEREDLTFVDDSAVRRESFRKDPLEDTEAEEAEEKDLMKIVRFDLRPGRHARQRSNSPSRRQSLVKADDI